LSEVKLAELKGVPGPVESTMTMSGRQWAKLSVDPYTFSGVGSTFSDFTWNPFDESVLALIYELVLAVKQNATSRCLELSCVKIASIYGNKK
jgi:hypothetical protein